MAGTLVVDLGTDATDDDLVAQMRAMKAAREGGLFDHVICSVRGFDEDPRELPDIPAVRAFCRRLVALGFISYPDYSTWLDPRQPADNKYALGAAEIWLIATGNAPGGNVAVTRGLLDEIEAAVRRSNAVADGRLGPLAVANDRL